MHSVSPEAQSLSVVWAWQTAEERFASSQRLQAGEGSWVGPAGGQQHLRAGGPKSILMVIGASVAVLEVRRLVSVKVMHASAA